MRKLHKKFHKVKHVLRNFVFLMLSLGLIFFGTTILWVSTLKLPDFSSFDSRKEINSTKVYDRTGTVVLYDLGKDVHRTSIPLADMGTNIQNATIGIEDSNFYQHHGIQPKAIVRALWADVTHTGIKQGGSTITQQVMKQSLLSEDKTIVRKIKEIILALKLERKYSKDEILAIYLNQIPYGGNIYGINEAAQTFFSKKPKDLTLAEAAYLAAIPNAPTHYSPYGTHKDDLENRKNLVLSREKTLKLITEDEYQKAKLEKVSFKKQEPQGIKAPHFVFFIKDILEQKYGADALESGGMKVITTLDYTMQKAAEKAITEYTTGEKQQIPMENAGLVAIDPKTGQILAMVGSRNYFDPMIDGNFNVTTGRRQPGSSFKPYIYVTAFEKGLTPETMLMDVPTEFSSSCDPYGNPLPGTGISKDDCYMPKNFDGTFHGPLSIRGALARSMNIPAVKTLYIVGIANAIKTAQDMGISTLVDASRYGLTLVLGGGEVKLLDMVSAYGVFAAEGIRHPYSGILAVYDKNGSTLEEWHDNAVQVVPRNPTLQISDILSDNKARTPSFGPNHPLYIKERQVAAKSGTTNDNKDSWAIGYTPSLVAGVWLGKNDATPMPEGVIAAPIWHEFMESVLPNYPVETFDKPDPDSDYSKLPAVLRGHFEGTESYVTDTISGKLATDMTPKETQKENVITDVHDILYWIQKDNILGGKPEHPERDPLFNNWETAVQNWWTNNKDNYPFVTAASKPKDTDTIHTKENLPKITVATPKADENINKNSQVLVSIYSTGNFPLQKIDIFLNDVFVGTAPGTYPSLKFSPANIAGVHTGANTLTIIATDCFYNTNKVIQTINII